MRKLLLSGLFIFQSLCLMAEPTAQNTLVIKDTTYNNKIEVLIKSDQNALITVGKNERFTVHFTIEDGKIKLKTPEENRIILSKLKIPATAFETLFPGMDDMENLEKILAKANEMPQRTLYIMDHNYVPSEQEELVQANAATGENVTEQSSNMIWWFVLPLCGLILGFVAGKMTNNKTVPPNVIEVDEETQVEISTIKNDAPAPVQEKKTRTNVNINQLKTKYDKLREDSKVLKQNYADLKLNHKELKLAVDADINYYKAAYNDIIVPLQNALDKGNLTEIFKYMTIASIQYSAISRAKLTKKQNYDITNINILLKKPSDHAQYPVLSSETPVDKTPQQLQQVISILKQLGVTNLDNYILQGYKLNNL